MLKAAHRTQATAVEVLEHRERTTAEALAPAQFGVQRQGVELGQRHVLLVLVVGLDVARVRSHAPLGVQTLIAARVRRQRAVTAVTRPANGERHRPARVAVFLGVVQVGAGDVGAGLDARTLARHAKVHGVQLGEGHTKLHAAAGGDQLVVATLILVRLDRLVEQVIGARHAARGEVRVGGAQHQCAVELAGVDFGRQVVARAKHVFLADREVEGQLFSRGEARTNRHAAGGLFLDDHVHVDLIGCARHFHGFQRDVSEVAQAIHAVARELHLLAVVPRRLHLAELAAHDFVARAGVALNVDLAHIGAARRRGI